MTAALPRSDRRTAAARTAAAGAPAAPWTASVAPAGCPACRRRPARGPVLTLLALALTGATVTATAAPAVAAWKAARVSSGSVATARFVYGTGTAAPTAPSVTAVSAAQTGTTGGLRLVFPASTLSGSGKAATGYRVVRTLTSGPGAGTTALIACGATPTSGQITCDDLSVPAGTTATYTQQPLYLRWAGAVSPASTATSWAAPTPPPGTVVPGTPTLTAGAWVNGVNRTAYAVSGSAAAGSLVTIKVTVGTTTLTFTTTATSAGTYSANLDLSTLPDGAVTIAVTAGNSAGTSAPQTSTGAVFKDTVAPAPTYTATSPLAVGSTFAGTNQTSSATPALSGAAGTVAASATTSADAGTVTVVVRDAAGTAVHTGTPARTGSPATAWSSSVPLPGLADAFYSVTVSQTDAAGNVGTSAAKSLRVEARAATASDVLVRNTTGTPKIVDVGDEVVLTYSERIDPRTVVTGWDGTGELTLDVTLYHGENAKDPDRIGPWTVTGGLLATRPANLGSVNLGAATYFRFSGTAQASLRLETPVTGGSVLVVRFTAYPEGISANSGGNETTVNWTPSALVTDLAGTPTGVPEPRTNRTTAF